MSLKIKLGSSWYIEDDGVCVTVFEKKIGKRGKSKGVERDIPHAYHSSLEEALISLIRKKITSIDLTSLEKIVEAIESCREEIVKQLSKLKSIPEHTYET